MSRRAKAEFEKTTGQQQPSSPSSPGSSWTAEQSRGSAHAHNARRTEAAQQQVDGSRPTGSQPGPAFAMIPVACIRASPNVSAAPAASDSQEVSHTPDTLHTPHCTALYTKHYASDRGRGRGRGKRERYTNRRRLCTPPARNKKTDPSHPIGTLDRSRRAAHLWEYITVVHSWIRISAWHWASYPHVFFRLLISAAVGGLCTGCTGCTDCGEMG
ncbi:hypothetical protein B0J11DRAFT_292859 [Dendryphion nanum]|uniref:Uncharacterized protein n=1 Tax=Dendryphion nanum TaxID=256645 RepID=A0A9P9DXT5_9PLEO|nr:hypothetical protein B0J11DRAFT_292859 [Dendryphion nanum]